MVHPYRTIRRKHYGTNFTRLRHHDGGSPSSNTNIQESLRALAKRYGINQKTVAKWKQRETVADLPTGPKEAKSTVLSIEEEAIIVAIRLPCRRCSSNGFTRSPERHTEGR